MIFLKTKFLSLFVCSDIPGAIILEWQNRICDVIPENKSSKKLNRPFKKASNLLSSNMMVVGYWFCPEEDVFTLREDIIFLLCLLDGILSIFKWHYLKLDSDWEFKWVLF